MTAACKVAALIFAAFILLHWLTAGTDDIVEGPPETPETSLYQQ